MALQPGMRLGPYEIIAPLGAGGMGEVYRARDERLSREVAIKVIAAAASGDPERLRRFEQEARAAGQLNHPNILAVYDIGSHDGAPYVVTELLEGETLRERLGGTPLPPRKVVELGVQIAQGLAAAHAKGIVHRDLKPENVFITRDGRAKILDFGLAKLTRPEGEETDATQAPTLAAETGPGVVLGTVGYMSPEQVRGRPADHRSDIFTFGSILYEMLTGRRAFTAESSVEALNAILKEEPPELSASGGAGVPPGLDRIVRHCMEKSPEERFQSARDLAFDLQSLSASSGVAVAAAVEPASRPRRRLMMTAAGLAAVVAAAALGWLAGRASVPPPASPVYAQLTYRQGAVTSARFAPDDQTVVYSAAWDGEPTQLFSTRAGSPESRPFDLPGADVLAISASGEMLVLLEREKLGGWMSRGTLARLPLAGGVPRRIMEGVQEADWAPDGEQMAVVRPGYGAYRVEFPPGKVLYQTAGWVSSLRFSPDGRQLAFLDHPFAGDDRGHVAVVSLDGEKRDLTPDFSSSSGLAWLPDGSAIHFTASERGTIRALRSVDLSGALEVVAGAPATLSLHDIAADGRHLVSRLAGNRGMIGRAPGADEERSLSWLDWSFPLDLSEDGRTLLFVEQGEGGGPGYSIYLRGTDGGPAVRLGKGFGWDLSEDGGWVVTTSLENPTGMTLLPTGPGEPRSVPTPGLSLRSCGWLPGTDRLWAQGKEEDSLLRLWVQEESGDAFRPVTPEGLDPNHFAPLPDGSGFAAADTEGRWRIYPVDGGEPQPLNVVQPGEAVVRWSGDGRYLFLLKLDALPLPVDRIEMATGRRERWLELMPADRAGLYDVGPLYLSADGASYAYSFRRFLTTLYILEGI